MIPLFTKPIRELNRADVQQLVDEAMPEGQTVDLKRELPANNRKGDKWLRDQSGVGDHARNKIFAEVISFVNAEGGNLIIGVDEVGDAPPRASEICPLPACHDLAERLRLMARLYRAPASVHRRDRDRLWRRQ
jgi:hypothetical protein